MKTLAGQLPGLLQSALAHFRLSLNNELFAFSEQKKSFGFTASQQSFLCQESRHDMIRLTTSFGI
jgi:hypothetical protein